ncbi:cyclodeaminase/cyclohydrolase family protein [Arcticibacter tournemirensis]|uniref:Cyclodeaminase/cyclohydrolase domain-containing protein n=1 Tax=Arcticibacter tournemirensis TaxID=699437 RepID=A0A4Q0MA11_9SPHI|nr:cyclodeaminase/cyclohydrolase family protein [Arcticibacter tournemirensis]RXF70061.1 hypothetical protein EKH83_09240 [Arcticibacter tournemirensis]
MQQREPSESIGNITLSQFLQKVTEKKPGITGGCVVLVTANMGLTLILMSLKLSQKKIRDKVIKLFLKEQTTQLQTLQTSLMQAADLDLEIFNRLRSMPRTSREKQKDPLYHTSLISAIESPLAALSLLNEIMSIVRRCTKHCKETFISDMRSGCLILSSAFRGLILIAESNMHSLPKHEKEYYTGIKNSRQETGENLITELN